ncbi:MAG: protein-glutamate O-methyltransferase CheR [Granulosicoccus sp.]|nr:protein-glutamate O-methyltransferase CheR [Granulosicoccus sp.]
MSTISDADFKLVRDLVYRESAISIEPDMKYLVESRLTSLARKLKYSGLNEVIVTLKSGKDEKLAEFVVEAMTTNETSFFRDSHPFQTLCEDVLPTIAATHSDSISIWCAACSTGQEPYTIAMAVHEHCPDIAHRIRIKATDISNEVVEKAASGRYTRLEVNRGLPVQLLTKYFDQQGLSWQVSSKLRDMVDFQQLNLIRDWPDLPKMDIIFLRNVLIYFDPDIKSRVLQNTCKVLKPGGCLFLGLSETTLNLNTNYQRVTTDRSHYYKIA